MKRPIARHDICKAALERFQRFCLEGDNYFAAKDIDGAYAKWCDAANELDVAYRNDLQHVINTFTRRFAP